MPVKKAVNAFTVERLNCAQSIIKAFSPEGADESAIADARKLSGGRADEGLCGALHAAMQLASDDDAMQKMSQAFEARAGSTKCREIRRAGTIKCEQCVELAAMLLSDDKRVAGA